MQGTNFSQSKRGRKPVADERNRPADFIASKTRLQGMGNFHVLSDKLFIELLYLVDLKDLTTIALCSRALYIFSRFDKVYQPQVFKRFRGDFIFKKNWRYTALLRGDREVKPEEFPKDLVFSDSDFRSDYMYRHWYRATVDKKLFDTDVSHIEKRKGVSVKDFTENYLAIGRPVVLADGCHTWGAMKWTPETLIRDYGDVKFRTNWGAWHEEAGKPKRIYMTMKNFWIYAQQQHDTEPGYVFDAKFADRAPGMLAEYDRGPYFQEDLLAVLGEHRPDYRWVLAGPAGSGSPWHVDPHATSAWNGLLYGRKRWGLYPPTVHPPGIGYAETSESVEYHAPKPFRWYIETYPFLKPEERPIELIQEPGQVIFVPAGWWHTVLNVTDTIAVTQNWLDRYNFGVGWTDMCMAAGRMQTEFFERLRYVRPELFAKYEEERRKSLDMIEDEDDEDHGEEDDDDVDGAAKKEEGNRAKKTVSATAVEVEAKEDEKEKDKKKGADASKKKHVSFASDLKEGKKNDKKPSKASSEKKSEKGGKKKGKKGKKDKN